MKAKVKKPLFLHLPSTWTTGFLYTNYIPYYWNFKWENLLEIMGCSIAIIWIYQLAKREKVPKKLSFEWQAPGDRFEVVEKVQGQDEVWREVTTCNKLWKIIFMCDEFIYYMEHINIHQPLFVVFWFWKDVCVKIVGFECFLQMFGLFGLKKKPRHGSSWDDMLDNL